MPQNSKTPVEKQRDQLSWIKLLATACVIAVYVFGLDFPLVGPDEPRYAQVAREMFLGSNWITPTLGGSNWFEKPALLYWVQIASYNIFGVSEFSARFGSAVFGLGTIVCLWIMARFKGAAKGGRGAIGFADWMAIVAASTIGIIVFSRGASFDIILAFPITAALTGFFVFERGDSGKSRYLGLVAFYFFIGVSLLAKGLVGLVFPLAIVSFYYLISFKLPPRSIFFSLVWGLIISLLTAAVWYLPMYQAHGYKFVDEFFIQHHFQRFTSNKYFHPQPFYFFLWVLPLMTIPWLPFFFAAVWKFIRSLFSGAEVPDNERDFKLFAVAWIAVPLVFFSFSGSKLPGYILPAVPGTILFTADYINNLVRDDERRGLWLLMLAGATFIVVIAASLFAVPRFADGDSVKRMITLANAEGFAGSNVVCMHVVSHNAEFYAAGRLLRDPDGKLKKLLGPAEVRAEAQRQNGRPLLVIVPLEYLHQITSAEYLDSRVISDNGEQAIAAVMEKPS